MSAHHDLISEYRDLREELETSVLSMATSVDGRRGTRLGHIARVFGSRLSHEGGADVRGWA